MRSIKTISKCTICLVLALCVVGCEPAFNHDVAAETKPWTHEQFDDDTDKFTFGVFSDLTGGEREHIFEIAVAQLNLLRPEFIVNVGDLIGGNAKTVEGLHAEWDWFDERADKAKAPLFYVGGNHDLTGAMLQSVWDERYGKRYYHFRYKDVLFLVLDTEDNTPERVAEIARIRTEAIDVINTLGWDAFEETEYWTLPERTTGNITQRQAEYFIDVVANNADARWTFLLMHKAAWERENETTFSSIESALRDRPYTVFHGHVQTYAYQERHGRDYIRLATTGGEQLPQFGRSMDHVTLVTVDDNGIDIANLLMEGILDKTGHIPLNGDDLCYELAKCRGQN